MCCDLNCQYTYIAFSHYVIQHRPGFVAILTQEMCLLISGSHHLLTVMKILAVVICLGN